jgi:hypothetical protein
MLEVRTFLVKVTHHLINGRAIDYLADGCEKLAQGLFPA